jgi:hypothetical protein
MPKNGKKVQECDTRPGGQQKFIGIPSARPPKKTIALLNNLI